MRNDRGLRRVFLALLLLLIAGLLINNWHLVFWRNAALVSGFFVIVVSVLIIAIKRGYDYDWIGFRERSVHEREGYKTVPEKTLWDWLQLLIVPMVISGIAFLFSLAQAYNQQLVADSQAETDRRIAQDDQSEAILQQYMDNMSELILNYGLTASDPEDQVRSIARTRTIIVLSQLDPSRKRVILQFLSEAELIDSDSPVISLQHADLSLADLGDLNIVGVSLSDVDFQGADMGGSNLSGSDLRGADFSDHFLASVVSKEEPYSIGGLFVGGNKVTNLTYAELREVNLRGANLSTAQFRGADLSGADLREARLSALLDCSDDGTLLTRLAIVNRNQCHEVSTNFTDANLTRAVLVGLDLTQVILENADLSEANLTNAKVDSEQLEGVSSLKGAIMPDGTVHP